jgi:hypothetical protein
MKNPVLPLLFLLTLLICGCGSERRIAGGFSLERWEDGSTFYLHKLGHDDSSHGGSIIEGNVLRIGWSNRFIVAERHSIFRGDPDGWMIIDLQSGAIRGPISEIELRNHPELREIQIYEASEAWKKL